MNLISLLVLCIVVTVSTGATTGLSESDDLNTNNPNEPPNSVFNSNHDPLNFAVGDVNKNKRLVQMQMDMDRGDRQKRTVLIGVDIKEVTEKPTKEVTDKPTDCEGNSSPCKDSQGCCKTGATQAPEEATANCTCVPYYQCTNETTAGNPYGIGMLDNRFDSSCINKEEICCNEQDTLAPTEKPNGNCELVSFYRCHPKEDGNVYGMGLLDNKFGDNRIFDEDLNVCCKPADILPPCGRRNIRGVGSHPKEDGNVYGMGLLDNKFGNNSGMRIIAVGKDSQALFGEFPWVVAIIKKEDVSPGKPGVLKCGGSLIHPRVVISAAHCFVSKPGKQDSAVDLEVRAGEWDTQNENEPLPSQTRAVKEIIIHENFLPGANLNDIALLILEQPVKPDENVATICLPEQGEDMDNRSCVASGWGKDQFEKKGEDQVILKKVQLPIVSNASCMNALRRTRLTKKFILHESFICAGGEIGKDTCKGDGGSPLACPTEKDPNTYVQAGIVSWGIGCGTETPGVYAKVSSLRDWIDTQVKKYFKDLKQ